MSARAGTAGRSPLQIAIVGGGSAAFACASRALELGAKVTLVESGTIGGTCVNTGCVPSKILIQAAQSVHAAQVPVFQGIASFAPHLNRAQIQAQQEAKVAELRHAKYESLLEANPALTLIRARASFRDAHTLKLIHAEGHESRLAADRILIATGAAPEVPRIAGLETTPYWTSSEALAAKEAPQHLIVLGASAVALELAQAFLRLGSRVTLLARSTVLSREDPDIGLGLKAILESEGMAIHTHSPVVRVHHSAGRFVVRTDHAEFQGDRILVATGRRPNTDTLGLKAIGVEVDRHGAILVDEHLRTTRSHIYAAGDCCAMPQFVYVAAAAGTRAAIHMTGGEAPLSLSVLPAVVFTDPQVATVGLSLAGAKARGIIVESRTLALDQVPRALANFDARGFIRLVAQPGTGRLLGAQVLASQAGEVIQSAALALQAGMTTTALAEQLFPYLTMVEGLKLCAQTFTRDVAKLSCCAG